MAVPTETIWKIQPHTEAKHAILRKYLGAWLPIMTRFNGRVIYIDGFSGPGRYEGGEEGSPIIALRAALEHRQQFKAEIVLVFIDKDPQRIAHLMSELEKFNPPKNVVVNAPICGCFDETLTGLLDDLDKQRATLAPAFAFIDPFGFAQTPFSVIRRIMENPKCEVLITFTYESIARWLNHPDHQETFDALFGTTRWREARDMGTAAERRRFLRDLYQGQLKDSAGIGYVRSFRMMDSGNRTEYFLFFGSNNILGLKRMKEAMWKVDPTGRFQFSDATDPRQGVLLNLAPDFPLLERQMLNRFGGGRATIDKIEAFVVEETAFTHNHYKRRVLKKLEYQEPPGIRIVRAPRNRRRGTYPAGTIIRFP